MTPIDTAELERLAESITPGEWEKVSISGYGSPFSIRMAYISDRQDGPKTHYGVQSVRTHADATLIAMAPALLHEVLAHRKAEAWQPISSVPKDGTTVMVYVPDFEKITEAWFCEQTGLWPHSAAYSEEGEPCNVGQPTHWRPLPAPPTTPEAEGGSDD